jgi:type III secretion protein L
MALTRGRVIPASATRAVTVVPGQGADRAIPRGRVVAREVAAARAEAHALLEAARAEAASIRARGERERDELRQKTVDEARREAEASLAAAWIRVRSEEAAQHERALGDTISLARALAERLLGEALALDETRIVALARQVLASARNARKVGIFAHPTDKAVLEREIQALGVETAAVEIHADGSCGRGSLRIRTDLGTLDADLTPQLDRLAAALRESLQRTRR